MARKLAVVAGGTDPAPTTVLETTVRSYLTEDEIEALLKATACERDRCMILMGFVHGLRVSELINLQWRQIDLKRGRLRVERLKGSENSEQPLTGREIRLLRAVQRLLPVGCRFVFMTRLGAPMTRQAFGKKLRETAARAGLDGVHPHLLRHATGYKLANDGHDTRAIGAYLGHANLNNVSRYTKMSSRRFDGWFR
jgi:type 1 fimbriae regulatory protein FimE